MNYSLLIPGLIFTAVFSAILIQFLGNWARKNGIGDVGGERHHHRGFIPVVGGIGFFFAMLVGWSLYTWLGGHYPKLDFGVYGIFAGMFIIHLTGILDDIRQISPLSKFIGATSAAVIYVATNPFISEINVPLIGTVALGVVAPVFSVIWVIGMINALNLIDGIDGLAGGVSIIIFSGIGYFAFIDNDYVVLTISLFFIFALLGFLVFNYPPAKVFMGDGSLLLGFTLGVLPQRVVAFENGYINIYILISLLLLPFFDTATAFFRRMLKGKNPFKPDKEHLHHRIFILGANSVQTMWILWILSAIFVLVAIKMFNADDLEVTILFAIETVFLFAGINRLGYLELRHKRFLPRWKFSGIQKYSNAPLILKRILHKAILLFVDSLAINIALLIFFIAKINTVTTAKIETGFDMPTIGDTTSILLTVFWLLLFYLNDLYKLSWDTPRTDRFVRLVKVISFGGLVMSFLVFDISLLQIARFSNLLIYLFLIVFFVVLFRFIVVFFEKKYRILEYSDKNSVIIGTNDKAKQVIEDCSKREDLYFNIVGCVDNNVNVDCLGTINDLPRIIHENHIQEVIIAGSVKDQEDVFDIIAAAENLGVSFKITKDLYEMVSGLKREDLFRYPLVDLKINSLRPWQKIIKRLLDLLLSSIGIVFGAVPVILYSAFLFIRDGKVFFKEIVIGRYGKPFYLYKWHTEKKRTSLVDRLFFRLLLNKVSFFISIFFGQISIVGPQLGSWTEVKTRLRTKPYYRRRFVLKPGLIGLSQMASFYKNKKSSLEVELELDARYLEKMSLSMDFWIMVNSLSLTLLSMIRGTK